MADAWCLIHQKSKEDIKLGASVSNRLSFFGYKQSLRLLVQLLKETANNKELRRDSLYYIATVQFRLEQYLDARK